MAIIQPYMAINHKWLSPELKVFWVRILNDAVSES